MEDFYSEIKKRHKVAMLKSAIETIFAFVGLYGLLKFIFTGGF